MGLFSFCLVRPPWSRLKLVVLSPRFVFWRKGHILFFGEGFSFGGHFPFLVSSSFVLAFFVNWKAPKGGARLASKFGHTLSSKPFDHPSLILLKSPIQFLLRGFRFYLRPAIGSFLHLTSTVIAFFWVKL